MDAHVPIYRAISSVPPLCGDCNMNCHRLFLYIYVCVCVCVCVRAHACACTCTHKCARCASLTQIPVHLLHLLNNMILRFRKYRRQSVGHTEPVDQSSHSFMNLDKAFSLFSFIIQSLALSSTVIPCKDLVFSRT